MVGVGYFVVLGRTEKFFFRLFKKIVSILFKLALSLCHFVYMKDIEIGQWDNKLSFLIVELSILSQKFHLTSDCSLLKYSML